MLCFAAQFIDLVGFELAYFFLLPITLVNYKGLVIFFHLLLGGFLFGLRGNFVLILELDLWLVLSFSLICGLCFLLIFDLVLVTLRHQLFIDT
jgi:hypothetical protein